MNTTLDSARIHGFPVKDGYYWYYELGEAMPSMVQAGSYEGERAVYGPGGRIKRDWYEGEFFVGPVEPPYSTPEVLAERVYDTGRLAAMKRKPQQSAGQAVSNS